MTGGPVIGALVKAIDLKDTTTSFSAITDENGKFRFDELKGERLPDQDQKPELCTD